MLIEIGKLIGRFVISASVGAIVENAIKTTTPVTLNTLQRVFSGIGGVILTSMISEKANDWVESTIAKVLPKKETPTIEVK